MSEAEVLDAVARRGAALARQDWSVLDELLDADFIYTNSQGTRLGRAEYLDFVRTGPLRWNAQSYDDVAVRVAGATAVLTGVVVDDVVVDGDRHVLRFATTQTYLLLDGRWSYLAGHTSTIGVA
jgi:hypothetical protein